MVKRNGPLGRDIDRREALRLGMAAAIGAASSLARGLSPVYAQGAVQAFSAPPNPAYPLPPIWETELKELAPGVYAYIQAGGPGRNNVAVSDAGVIVGDDGLMIFDALAAPFHAKAMIERIRRVSDKPFRHLITSHHHGDHIGGNQYITGAEIIGHPYCREEVLKAVPGPALWAKREGWADGTEERRILPPVTTIEHKVTYYYGKTVVEVFPLLPAHTYGDLVAYLPQHKILFAGDVGFFYVAPFCQNANPSNWISIVDQIMKMDVDVIVPGHGPVGGKQQIAEMGDYLRTLKTEARKRYDARMSPGSAAADIRLGRFENWIGPERIIMDTVRFYAEFGGTLTPAVDNEGNNKATEEYNAIMTKKSL